jgi:hypothetical protein
VRPVFVGVDPVGPVIPARKDNKMSLEAFYNKGAQHARAGLSKYTREQWRSEGFHPDDYRMYARGYDETFEAMTPEQKKAAAFRSR